MRLRRVTLRSFRTSNRWGIFYREEVRGSLSWEKRGAGRSKVRWQVASSGFLYPDPCLVSVDNFSKLATPRDRRVQAGRCHKEQAEQKIGVLEKQRAQLLAEVDGLKKRISALEEQRAKMAEAETAKSLALQFNKEHAEAEGDRDAAQKAVDSESAKVQQIEQAAVKSQQQLEKCMTLLSLQKLNLELQSL